MQPVTITDNLQTAVGAYIGGVVTQVEITWNAFAASDGSSVDAGRQIFALKPWETFMRPFIPNEGATPATDYTFAYTVKRCGYENTGVYTEDLTIPSDQGATVSLTACRVTGIINGPSGESSVIVPTGIGAAPSQNTTPTLLSATESISAPSVPDGVTLVLPQTITLVGAIPGSPVSVGVYPGLPDGFTAAAQVTAANTVTVSLTNNSGAEQAPTAASYTVSIVA